MKTIGLYELRITKLKKNSALKYAFKQKTVWN